MAAILDEIVAYKREFVDHRRRHAPLADLKSRADDKPSPPAFAARIRRPVGDIVCVIAEVKKGSPSKGVIREDFDPVQVAVDYAEHGAAAVSVLTDEHFFLGHLDYLRQIRTELPDTALLRKDFTIDEYQIYEAREAGASAILLITSILDKHQLVSFRELAEHLGMDALTEVHLESEADRAAELGAKIIGINNRDLQTFEVHLDRTEKIIRFLGGPMPGYIFVAESGISKPEHVETLSGFGVDAILVGECFMKEESPGKGIGKLLGRGDEDDMVVKERKERQKAV